MDTGAAAFSLPIFRPALLSFTWQTPPALPSESLLFDNAALHLLPAAKHRFFPFQNTRLQSLPTHFPSHVLSTTCTRERAALFLLSFSSLLFITHSLSLSLVLSRSPSASPSSSRLARRVYDRNSFTCSLPVTQRNVAFLSGLPRGIKCARGQGISDEIRVFDPSILVAFHFCAHRSANDTFSLSRKVSRRV